MDGEHVRGERGPRVVVVRVVRVAAVALVDGDEAWTDSDAIRRVLTGLGGMWRLAGVIAWVPRAVRDPLYRWIARNRYRLFGRYDSCLLPDPDHQSRFLDSAEPRS